MTQRLVIANIEVKEGDTDKGHWKNYIITGEDKVKASTFDSTASFLKVGDTIEVEIELKGKYANIKSFKKIAEGRVPDKVVVEAQPQVKMASDRNEVIAEQVAFKGVIDLVASKVIRLDHRYAMRAAAFIERHLPIGILEGNEPKPVIEPISKPSPATLQAPTKPVAEVAGSNPPPIDLDWFKESLDTLNWADVGGYLKRTYKVTGTKVSELVEKLTPEQRRAFTGEVKDRLDMLKSNR